MSGRERVREREKEKEGEREAGRERGGEREINEKRLRNLSMRCNMGIYLDPGLHKQAVKTLFKMIGKI